MNDKSSYRRVEFRRLSTAESPAMDLAEFAALHTPALQADEVRFNQLIAAIAAAAQERPAGWRDAAKAGMESAMAPPGVRP